jgi:hypothetical protein
LLVCVMVAASGPLSRRKINVVGGESVSVALALNGPALVPSRRFGC